KATTTIRAKRQERVDEVPDWEQLRDEGTLAKDEALRDLGAQLQRLERAVTDAGGNVHWARDATEANAIVARLTIAAGGGEVVKVKSMVTEEIGLNAALAELGIVAYETDLAELIVQLADDRPSHILAPAIHFNREEIRELFEAKLGRTGLSAEPAALTTVAREYLRQRFLEVGVGVSGANFAVAETGTVCVVESEGNGRMCTTLPDTLITVMGIEKVVPRFQDLAPMLTMLPRSATGERMNPYTSLWTGVTPGDGPQSFHLVLLDNGRTDVLADEVGRQALRCIRCSACVNVCPVYERTGGHAYEATYSGPIGAILTPQLAGLREGTTLPWASSLCGACYEVCPVKIEIPKILVHLRGRVVRERGGHRGERFLMDSLRRVFATRRGYERAQRLARAGARPLARDGRVTASPPGPLGAWTRYRDLPEPAAQTFREWWRQRS
ncbi:MAG: lactate utilization protein B, partial [Solirubrobacterales bacterium]